MEYNPIWDVLDLNPKDNGISKNEVIAFLANARAKAELVIKFADFNGDGWVT